MSSLINLINKKSSARINSSIFFVLVILLLVPFISALLTQINANNWRFDSDNHEWRVRQGAKIGWSPAGEMSNINDAFYTGVLRLRYTNATTTELINLQTEATMSCVNASGSDAGGSFDKINCTGTINPLNSEVDVNVSYKIYSDSIRIVYGVTQQNVGNANFTNTKIRWDLTSHNLSGSPENDIVIINSTRSYDLNAGTIEENITDKFKLDTHNPNFYEIVFKDADETDSSRIGSQLFGVNFTKDGIGDSIKNPTAIIKQYTDDTDTDVKFLAGFGDFNTGSVISYDYIAGGDPEEVFFARGLASSQTDCTVNLNLSTSAGSADTQVDMTGTQTRCWDTDLLTEDRDAGFWVANLFTRNVGGGGTNADVNVSIQIVNATGFPSETIGTCVFTAPGNMENICNITGVGSKTLTADRIRYQIQRITGDKALRIRYDGALGGSFDSRLIVPIVTVGDVESPQWFDNRSNGTFISTPILHNVRWTDVTALSGYIFSFDNGSGVFINDSFVGMIGTANWSNVTKIINSTKATTIQWRVYANDSGGFLNATDIFSYITTGYGNLEVNITSPINNLEVNVTQLFQINSTVSCVGNVGDICGTVQALARYNLTANPDTRINTTSGANPFFVVGGTGEWNLTSAVVFADSVAQQDAVGVGMFFSDNGTRLYESGTGSNLIYQSICSEAWNISTCSADTTRATADANPNGMHFKTDGTELYESTNTNLYRATCSTAWDIDSCTANGSIGVQDASPSDIFFRDDGTRMYELGSNTGNIYQYECSVAWNLTSCTFSSISIVTQDSVPSDMFFKSDGTRLYYSGTTADLIYEHTCSDSWNISSCDYFNVNISTQDDNPGAIFFKPDGTRLYEMARTDTTFYQYALTPGEAVAENPFTSSETLEVGEGETFNWTVNVTNSSTVSFLVDVFFNSSFGNSLVPDNSTDDRRVDLNPSVIVIVPQWFDNRSNGTFISTPVLHSVNWTDVTALSGYVFSFDNGSGVFVNDSFVGMIGVSNWSNVTKTINSTKGTTIQWRIYANNSANNFNVTDIFSYITTGYGNLEVNITSPLDNLEVNATQIFHINSTVTCVGNTGDICGTVKSFARYNLTANPDTFINITGGANPFYIYGSANISSASLVSPTIASQDDTGGGMWFSSNGTRLYEVGRQVGGDFYQYSCTEAWNLTTCTYDTITIASQDAIPSGMSFSDDGTRMYEIGDADLMYEYICSTAWGLDTCSFNISIATQDTTPTGMFFGYDGQRLYEIGRDGGGDIYQYTCTNSWTLGSCTYDTVSIATQDPTTSDLFFSRSGAELFELGSGNDIIYQYDCNDGWDLSSCNHNGATISTQGATPNAIFIKPDGKRLYEYARDGGGLFYQLNLTPTSALDNPQTSSQTLEIGESETFNWTVNVTNTTTVSFLVDVFFNSSFGNSLVPNNNTNDRRVDLNPTGVVADSCVCPSINTNWELDLTDSCQIFTDCNIGDGNITFINTGNATFNATITAKFMNPPPDSDGVLFIGAQCLVNLG